jgi:hypothetical protein
MIARAVATGKTGQGTLTKTIGKGTTLVVPPMAPSVAALAAEGDPGVRFVL